MTVSEQVPYQKYKGNGFATTFALPFGGDVGENIAVSVDAVTLVYDVDYTVSGLTEASGTVTFDVAPAEGAAIIIWRDTPIERSDDYAEHGVLPASGLNADLDRVTRIVQENAAKYDRLLDALPDVQTVIDNIEDVQAAADLVSTRIVNTIADLRNLPSALDSTATVLGYYTAGDGGGGTYYYDAVDLLSVDDGGATIVGDDNGRWKLIATDWVSVNQFGAKPVEGFDNHAAFASLTAWLKAAGNKARSVRIPRGTYEFYETTDEEGFSHWTLDQLVGINFYGDGCLYGTILKAMSTDAHLMDVTGSSIGCTFHNIKFDRDYAEIGGYTVSKAEDGGDGVHFHSCWNNPNFMFTNCLFTHHYEGVRTSTARMLGATFTGCAFLNNAHHGCWLSMNNEDRFIACIANGNGWHKVGSSRVKNTTDASGEYGAGWRIGNPTKVNGAASVGGVYFDSPTTWGNAGHGIHLEGADNGVYPASAIQITNGFLDSSGLSGLFIQFAWGVHVSSTKFSWNDQRGLHVGYGVTEVTVAGSTMHDNVLEGTLIYGSAKNVTLSGCQHISNNRDVSNYAYGIRIAGPCEDIHVIGGSSGNGPAVLTNGASPGTDPDALQDYTIPRNCQWGGIRIEKIAGADSPKQVHIRGVSFPDMDAARLVTYSSGSGVDVGNEIYCDVGRDWTPVITDSAGTPAPIAGYTIDRAKYWRTGTDKVEISLRFTITDDGGKTGNIGVSLPVTSDWQAGPLLVQDHGAGTMLVGAPYGAGMWIQASGGGNVIAEHTYAVHGSYSLTVVT